MTVFEFGHEDGVLDWCVAESLDEARAALFSHYDGDLDWCADEDGKLPVRALTVEEADAIPFVDEAGTRLRSMFDEAARQVLFGTAPTHIACSEW